MPTAAVSLRAAIHDALLADAILTGLLGGPRVYDEPPRGPAFPYVTIGEWRVADWSTATEPGEEHRVTLRAWSRQGGHREAHAIAGALVQALEGAPIDPSGHHVVSCRFVNADIRRERDGQTYQALVRFRMVTEPA